MLDPTTPESLMIYIVITLIGYLVWHTRYMTVNTTQSLKELRQAITFCPINYKNRRAIAEEEEEEIKN